MPPPMMTILAEAGRSVMAVSSEGGEGGVEPRPVLGSVGGIVEVDRRMSLGDHAPQRLAQQRRRRHRRRPPQQARVRRAARNTPRAAPRLAAASIPALDASPPRSKSGVLNPAYSQSTSQSRAPSSRMFAGSRSLCPKTSSTGPVAASSARGGGDELPRHLPERVDIVAKHLEHPEQRRRPAEMPRDLPMAAAHQRRPAARGSPGRAPRPPTADAPRRNRAPAPPAASSAPPARRPRHGRRDWPRARCPARSYARECRRRSAPGIAARRPAP